MSLVSGAERYRLLRLVGSGSSKRDAVILSLARKADWTEAQRTLADRLIREAAARNRVAAQRSAS